MIRKLLIVFIPFILWVNKAEATHVSSADLTYECLGGLNYRFTLKVYRDCSGIAVGAFQAINYKSTACSSNGSFLLFQDTTYEVSQVCDSMIPLTTCNGGTLPGIQVYIYSANFTLGGYCNDWEFDISVCCRSTSLTNLMAGFSFYTSTTLDNSGGKCNDSPTFNAIPILYSCLNETVNFNNIATDKEGDSLSFKLVRTLGGKGLNVPYTNTSFSATNPFSTVSGILFDSITGQITFTSPSLQQVTATLLITEYDSLGNVKGTQLRDIQFIFITCPPPPFNPYTTGVNFDTTNYTYTGCYNESFCFDVYSVSFDTIHPIELKFHSSIPGATFTTTVKHDTTFGTFCWNPGTSIGKYYFILEAIAQTCPLKRKNSFNYTIDIDTFFNTCIDTTLYLSTSGYHVIDSSFVLDAFYNGMCPIQSVTLSKDTFDCSDLGVNTVTVTTLYTNGLVRTCNSTVTILDTISPIAGCVDTSVYLNSSGVAIIDSSYIHDYTIVSCGTATITLDKYSFFCSDVGPNRVELVVTENNGLTDTCFGILTVIDTFFPTAICKDTSIYLDSSGQFIINDSYVDNGSHDNCAISDRRLSKDTFDCSNIGANVVWFYVEDFYGNVDSCSSVITVLDTNKPFVNCKDTTLYLNAGVATLTFSHVNSGSSASCGIASTRLSKYAFNCSDTGANLVTLTITDSYGNSDSCTSIVTVIDTTKSIFTCKDTTIYLDALGTKIIDSTYTLDSLIQTSCNLQGFYFNMDTFTCSEVGGNTVTLYLINKIGKQDSCVSLITVIDTVKPIARCKGATVYLGANGTVQIDSSYINNLSSDNCGIATISLSKSLFTCADIGTNTITMTVTDINGNSNSCASLVTIIDSVAPTAICKDTIVYLNSLGLTSIDSSYVNNGSYDSCGIATISISNSNYDCSNMGLNTVIMTVTDIHGNVDFCTANVTILDTVKPVANCQNTTVYLNASGNASIDSSYINNGSTDNCGIASILINQSSFDCSHVGVNSITMTVVDENGNSDTCSAWVTVVDSISPTAHCKDTLVYLSAAGTVIIDSSYINNGSTDNCGISSIVLSQTLFNCADVGTNMVSMTVTDENGNTAICSAIVTVADTNGPIAICKDTTIFLNSLGIVSIDSSYVNGGGADSCGIANILISPSQFNCSHIGSNIVSMTVIDLNGNRDSCLANVTVLDTINPIANCQNISIYLNASGNASIDSSDINNGSIDNCGIATISLNRVNFNCAQLGINNVTMTVTDIHGNVDSCISVVTVIDSVRPVALCTDTIVYINSSGFFTITNAYVDNGSYDNCILDSVSLSKYTFTCSDVGFDTVSLYAYDSYGNVDSCRAIVQVLDTTNPIANCNDTTVYLNGLGTVTIDSTYINNTAAFGCAISSISLSKYVFNCSEIGVNSVTMVVTDVNGNSDSCVALVTVLDTLNPVANCQNITAYINGSGIVTIDSADINNGSSDNCGIATIKLDQTSFNCAQLGLNTVRMVVTDLNGNTDTCLSIVSVVDTINPSPVSMDTTIYINAGGSVSITNSYIDNGSFDNCSLDSIWLSKYVFDCYDFGKDTIQLYARDNSGNMDSCQAIITVLDTTNPIAVCADTTIYLSAAGVFTIDSTYINQTPSYGCDILNIRLSQYVFNCSHVGVNSVSMFVTDVNGNSDTCSANVRVLDTLNPIVNCQSITVYLDALGNAAIDSSDIDNGSVDNCGISTISLSQTNFNCSHAGTNLVSMVVTDVNGNIDSCLATVTVVDSILPTVRCMDTIIYLDSAGNFTIDSTFVNNNSVDNCGINTIKLSQYNFGCSDVGTVNVTMTVEDMNGNVDSCISVVTVVDTIIPTVFAGNDTNICGYFTINLCARPTLPYHTGTWSNYISPVVPTIANVNSPISSVSNLSIGSHSFIWSVTNGNGCNVVRDTVEVNILDTLFALGGPDINLCNQYSTALSGTPTPYGITGTWSYTGGALVTPSMSNPLSATTSVTGLSEGTFPFVWTVSNGLCVDVYDTVLVEVYNSPTSNAGVDQNLCGNYSTNLSGNPTIGRASGVWRIISSTNSSSPVFSDSTNSSATLSSLQEGTYRLTWTQSNGSCPSATDTMVINVYDLPVSYAGPDTLLCGEDSLRLLAQTISGTSTGVWSFGGISPRTFLPQLSDTSLPNADLTNLTLGTSQTMIWTVSNGTCPSKTDSVLITVLAQPVANAGADSSYCSPISISLNATPVSLPSIGYWSLDTNSSPNVPMMSNKNSATTSVTGLIEGVYTFIWNAQNYPCYMVSDTVIISVYNQHVAVASNDQYLCNQPRTPIIGNSVSGLALAKWRVGSSTPNTPTFDSLQHATILDSMLEGGVYQMIWEITNGVCPVSRDTVTIHNQHMPVANFIEDRKEICQGESINFYSSSTVSSPATIALEDWTINYSETSGAFRNETFDNPGYYGVKIVVTASNGCRDTLQKDSLIYVHLNPTAGFTADVNSTDSEGMTVNIADLSENATSYLYTMGDGNSFNIPNPFYTYGDTGRFTIWQYVYNSFGCKDSASNDVYIQFLAAYMPNAFTPNGDGTNDEFIPVVSGDNPKNYEFVVYNRWGEVMFKTKTKGEGWNGKKDGQSLPNDTYIWTLTTQSLSSSKTKVKRGHVNLIR